MTKKLQEYIEDDIVYTDNISLYEAITSVTSKWMPVLYKSKTFKGMMKVIGDQVKNKELKFMIKIMICMGAIRQDEGFVFLKQLVTNENKKDFKEILSEKCKIFNTEKLFLKPSLHGPDYKIVLSITKLKWENKFYDGYAFSDRFISKCKIIRDELTELEIINSLMFRNMTNIQTNHNTLQEEDFEDLAKEITKNNSPNINLRDFTSSELKDMLETETCPPKRIQLEDIIKEKIVLENIQVFLDFETSLPPHPTLSIETLQKNFNYCWEEPVLFGIVNGEKSPFTKETAVLRTEVRKYIVENKITPPMSKELLHTFFKMKYLIKSI